DLADDLADVRLDRKLVGAVAQGHSLFMACLLQVPFCPRPGSAGKTAARGQTHRGHNLYTKGTLLHDLVTVGAASLRRERTVSPRREAASGGRTRREAPPSGPPRGPPACSAPA